MKAELIEKKYGDEVKTVYKLYMDFFDNKIDINVLYEKENVNKGRYDFDMDLIGKFIIDFYDYAKENYGIEDLEKYVANSQLFKKCYEIYISYVNGDISVGEYLMQVENTKIDIASYRKIIKKYAQLILIMSKLDIKKLMSKSNHKKNVLELIEQTNDENKIFEILTDYGRYKNDSLENGNLRLGDLKNAIFNYVVVKYKLDKNELDIKINSLNDKIQKVMNIYNSMLKDEKKEQRELVKNNYLEQISKQSIELITKFISTNLTITDFLKEKGITRKDFDDALTSISKYDPELYKKYNDHINIKQSERYVVLVSKIDSIVDMIKNGIINEETNTKKDFDILDYYINTNLRPEEFLNIAIKKYKGNDLRLIRTFFANNRIKYNEEKIIRETKFIINSVEITDEHKDIVINYLKQINAPISTKIFKIALKRYLKNELIIEEETNRKTR